MKLLVSLFAISLSFHCYADNGYYLLIGAGISESDVNSTFLKSGFTEHNENIDYQLHAGYQFDSDIQLEVGYNIRDGFDLFGTFDSIDIAEYVVKVGYRLDISENLIIIPSVGSSRWQLISQEGIFFNPGPEEKFSARGSNTIFTLSAVIDNFYATYQSTNYNFGSFTSLIVGVKIKL